VGKKTLPENEDMGKKGVLITGERGDVLESLPRRGDLHARKKFGRARRLPP